MTDSVWETRDESRIAQLESRVSHLTEALVLALRKIKELDERTQTE